MRKWRGKRGAWLFASVSALLHVAWFALLRETDDERRTHRSTTIELQVIASRAPEPAPLDPAPETQPPTAATPAPLPERRRERVARPVRPEPSVVQKAPATVAELAPAPPASAAPLQPSAARPSTLDLSPRRAASSMLDDLEVARVCSPNSGAASAPACEPPDPTAKAQRVLNESLRASANAPEYRKPREPPQLAREADGGYRYEGHVFTARIRPDGHVDFLEAGAEVTGMASAFPGVAGRFDLTDAIEHGVLGKERNSAEKRWFLDETSAVREQLMEKARVAESQVARRALERALERILAANELSPAQKREHVLSLWEDCGDDADSKSTRRKVEAFVRERMPFGSALGFTQEELERFNRGRSGMDTFEPYRSG